MKSSKRKKALKQTRPSTTEGPAMSILQEDLSSTSQDNDSVGQELQDVPSGPKLMIELEGNGQTVSVSCTKKEIEPNNNPSKAAARMSSRSTFLNNRKYTYDYFCQDNICRLCWSTTNITKSIEHDTPTSEKILEYIGVDITAGTPKTVCSLCLIKIESFIRFKKLCQEADRKLKIILSNSPLSKVKSEKNYETIFKREPKKLLDKKLNIKLEKASSDFECDDDSEFPKDNYCSVCSLIFDSTEEIIKHNEEVHKNDIGTFECYGCNNTFEHKLKLCKDTMEYSCSSCCKCVPTRRAKCHVRGKCEEQKSKVYKCEICSETFKVHLDWRKHMAVHRKEMKYVCETCGRVLKNKKSLSEHMLIHTSNKQLKCPHCDYHATLKTSLVYHIRLHTGERPYACDRCPYTCVTSSNLRRHINTTHLGIRAYKCQICNKEYMYKRSLKEHITSAHQGKKENMCKRCGALYFRFEHLRKHILVKHRKVIKKVREDYFEINDAGFKRVNKYKLGLVTQSGT